MEARVISEPAQGEFEFNAGQNVLIEGLAGGMRFVGTFNVVIGVIIGVFVTIAMLVALVSRNVAMLAPAIFQGLAVAYFLLVGAWLRRAGVSFKYIVTSEGRDIANLMSALAKLAKFFRLWKGLIIASLCLGALAVIVMIATGSAMIGMLAAHGGP